MVLFCLSWAGAALSAQPNPTEPDGGGFAVLALDTVAQRAVIRGKNGRPITISKGDMVPGSTIQVVSVIADRIEVDVTQSGGYRQRQWWTLDAATGKTRVLVLDTKPDATAARMMSVHGEMLQKRQ
jgi:hypothetical protein